ncbi:hypothetical protein D3C72_1904510 [compost metagenome]
MQLEVALIGPEPGQRTVRRRFAHQTCSHGAGLVNGVLHRFKAGMFFIVLQAREIRDIAQSGNPWVRGEQVGIHLDAVLDGQACFCRQLRIGDHADAKHHQVGGQGAAVGGLHRADFAVVAIDAAQSLAEVKVHAPLFMCLAEQF